MNMTQTGWKSWISAARVIGTLLVVLGHSYPFNVPIPAVLNELKSFIYTFHMPLFILISGYLSVWKATGQRNIYYIAARAKKLLVPYFVLSLAAFVPKMLVQQYLNDSVEFSFLWLIRSELVPRENVWGHFWYIPVVFFLGVFSAFCGKRLKERKRILILALAASYLLLYFPETTNWFALEDIRQNLFYYILGIGLARVENPEKLFQNKLWLLGLPAALLLFFSTAEIKALGAVLMVGFLFCVGTMAEPERCPICRKIECYSFTIFLLSWPAQAVAEVLLNKLLHLPALVTMLGMFAVGILVPLICVKVVERLEKWIPVRWLRTAMGL